MRLTVIHNTIFLLLGLVISALFYMQIIRGDFYRAQSVNNRIRVVPIDAPRGRILERNDKVLADNRPSFHVAVIPQDIEDKEKVFNFLGQTLKKSPKAIKALYDQRRLTPFDPVVVGEDIDKQTVISIEENRFQYPGIVIEESFERFYPYHDVGAHMIGYVGRIDPDQIDVMREYGYTPLSLVGKNGIELFYQSLLEGDSGGRQIEVNNRGQEVRLLGLREPSKGKDIKLSVDQRIQSAAYELLSGRRGSVVVMDMSNGDILGLVSSPSYDPNVFTDRSQKAKIKSYMQNAYSPLLNRSVSGKYPPGSVFKVLVALAALERQKITSHTTYQCPGFYMMGTARFGCAHEHGDEDLLHAIAHSCNVYFYRIGQMVTAQIIGGYAKAFGLNRPTGVDLPFETQGRLILPENKRDRWFPGNTLNLSIGQGDTLTSPLQLTVLMSAVANKGIIVQPRLLNAIDGAPMPLPDLSKRPLVRLSDSTWRLVQEGLRMTITDQGGTAHELSDLSGMNIWGKTGTAQSGKLENHAWFAGYVRSPKNNLAFCVFLEHGGSSANAVGLTHELLLRMQSFGVI